MIRAKEVVVMLVRELCNRLELLCVIILYLIQWNRTPTSANNCEPFLVSCTHNEWILSKAWEVVLSSSLLSVALSFYRRGKTLGMWEEMILLPIKYFLNTSNILEYYFNKSCKVQRALAMRLRTLIPGVTPYVGWVCFYSQAVIVFTVNADIERAIKSVKK